MRYFVPKAIIVVFISLLASPAFSEADTQDANLLTKTERLDAYFKELKRTRNPSKASDITTKIWSEWNASGSATVDLLLAWARDATHKRRYPAALDFLDRATTLAPDYAEAWNKRATLHYHMGNFKKSMSDITRVLALEPRHFGALAGMAAILERTGNDEKALNVWKHLLEVFPGDRQAQRRFGELSEKVAGQKT